MLVPVSEEDRQKKAQGVPAGFVNGRQKGLDKWVDIFLLWSQSDSRYLASAPEEFKDFIQQKAEGNKQLVELFAGNLDVSPFRLYCDVADMIGQEQGEILPHRTRTLEVHRYRHSRSHYPSTPKDPRTICRR